MYAILMWNFNEAPDALRALSDHGGDEDYLIVIPAVLADDIPWWVEAWWDIEWRSKSEFRQDDGSIVRIAAHA